tara:strand:+ start:82 stop:531 length:450 start_codon:yes stop_codon:yes gene_type:complete
MKELGMVLLGCFAIFGFFAFKIHPTLEYSGYSSNSSCTGECYEEYVRVNGTSVDILRAKQALAAGDPFSDIRSLWTGCAGCHGQQGQGMSVFPKLAGQNKDYIVSKLNAYKNKEQVGAMSSTMWAQADMLSAKQMDLIGEFIENGMPGD